MNDVIIVGCGFAGAVCARRIAESGKKVLIIEKREHIGGNMYDALDEQGILIHKYGPHIFHTNNQLAFEFLKPFSEWSKYEHKVLGYIDNKFVPIPFNYKSIEQLFSPQESDDIKARLRLQYKTVERVSVLDLIRNKDREIQKFGNFVYEKVFAKYTAKQWGIPIEAVDKSVINRVPVLLNYDNRYFQDQIQLMPKYGFTKLFENLLNHENIKIILGTNSSEVLRYEDKENKIYFKGKLWNKPVIYTGAIDEFFDCRFGRLPYRSIELVFENLDVDVFQPAAVVNYTVSEDFTRITEFKKLTGQTVEGKTTILKEYPSPYIPDGLIGNVPYYPIIEDNNLLLYDKYRDLAQGLGNFYPCGRLAEYSYYNMDAVIDRAIKVVGEIVW